MADTSDFYALDASTSSTQVQQPGVLDVTGQGGTFSSGQLPNGATPRQATVPLSVMEGGLLSGTSLARDCFVQQYFSEKLQAYLVGYVNTVYSQYAVLG
jgi:hypothetical protein